jgi:hypothetical protein
MSSISKIQNRLHKIKVEIMNLEETIERAERDNKPFFANRLRMIIQDKLSKISTLVSED